MFGGLKPNGTKVDDMYLFDFTKMVSTVLVMDIRQPSDIKYYFL